MPIARGAGAAEEEDQINTLAAVVDTLQTMAAQAKAAEDAAENTAITTHLKVGQQGRDLQLGSSAPNSPRCLAPRTI